MSVAEQIITTVQSFAIPFLAIMTFLAVLSTMKAPGKETTKDETNFKVTESSFWLMIAFYCLVAVGLFAWLSVTNTAKAQIVSNYIMMAFCAVGCVICMYVYFRRNLVVNGDQLIYTPIKGKAETFDVKAVSKMEIVQKDYYDEMCVYNKNGKLMFKVQGYMTNTALLPKYMRLNKVRIVKLNMEK